MFFDRWGPASLEINDTLKRVDEVDEDDGHKIFKMEVNFPWPLWNRIMIVTLYPATDLADGEQQCWFSCVGNEAMKEKHFTEDDAKNFVLASQNIGGWLLKPIKDADGNVTGTHMMFANAASVGGIIPDAVTNSQVPKSVAAMTQGTIAWVRKNKGS